MNVHSIAIPKRINFSDLALSRSADGLIRYKSEVLATVAHANGLAPGQLAEPPAFGEFLLVWYRHHCGDGGMPDLVMELLIAEGEILRERGIAVLQPGSSALQ